MTPFREDNGQEGLSADLVKELCDRPFFVETYRRMVQTVGLWESEKVLAQYFFRKTDRLLDLGCGAGRATFGLWDLGFSRVEGLDLAPGMIAAARELARKREIPLDFREGTALDLPYADGSFQGVFFSAGGWMQIPGRENRRQALREIHRILSPGGIFLATTHAREMEELAPFWEDPERMDEIPAGGEFGDLLEESEHGEVFIHVPAIQEVEEDFGIMDWEDVHYISRSQIADEPEAVHQTSDECLFWHARKKA